MERDRGTPAGDVGIVAQAAAAIEVSEYTLFQLAYRWWYGRPAPVQMLDQAFAAYLREAKATPWARHFGRELLSCDPREPGHRQRLGLDRLPAPPAPPAHAWVAVSAVLAGLVLGLATLALGASDGAHPRSAGRPDVHTLKCAPAPGLRAFDSLARALAERPPPDCGARR